MGVYVIALTACLVAVALVHLNHSVMLYNMLGTDVTQIPYSCIIRYILLLTF